MRLWIGIFFLVCHNFTGGAPQVEKDLLNILKDIHGTNDDTFNSQGDNSATHGDRSHLAVLDENSNVVTLEERHHGSDLAFDYEDCVLYCDWAWPPDFYSNYRDTCWTFCRRVFKKDLQAFNEKYEKVKRSEVAAAFTFLTNMTGGNHIKLAKGTEDVLRFEKEQADFFRKQLTDTRFYDKDSLRQMELINFISITPSNTQHAKELVTVSNQLQRIYGTGRVCDESKTCYSLGQLEQIFDTSRDSKKLLWAWKEWRRAVGPPIRQHYPRFVELLNEGAKDNNFEDIGDYLRQSNYETSQLESIVEGMWNNIQPVYEQLHAYVRRKLQQIYPNDGIQDGGPIPAHLLGNMWAQTWEKLYELVTPYPEVSYPDVTNEMLKQKFTVRKMYEVAEDFFTSLGFDPMTPAFWNKSMFEKPKDGRPVQCHPLSFDMFKPGDFRIKMCTLINSWHLTIVHHEMGHIAYFMQYEKQPVIYRNGANSAFHEAVGDVIALSVNTPNHLRKIGLLKEKPDATSQKKRDINFLMQQALLKIAFVPFGLLIDKWRWDVFKGNIDETNYNKKWWDMRLHYQGIKPPVSRTETDFDPGSKFHIPYNVPYIRYFLSFQIQFQFHKALCDAAGHVGSIYTCDIYNSTRAGRKLRKMLKRGRRYHWKRLMKRMTGQTTMNNDAMIEYFQPLIDWLKEQNEGHKVGWTI